MAVRKSTPGQQLSARDLDTYARVGWTLLGGLVLSVAVMVLGLVLVLIEGARVASQVLPLDQVPANLARGQIAAVLDLGILLLFATPLAGVLVALEEFIRQRDFPFVLVAAILLVMLVIGFAVALR